MRAKELIGRVRLGVARLGLHDSAQVRYGGQARRGGHRVWIVGNVLGAEHEALLVIPRAEAADEGHMQGFVTQALEEACLMGLANLFRP